MTDAYAPGERENDRIDRQGGPISRVDPREGTSADGVSMNAISITADALDHALNDSPAQERDQLDRSDASNRVEQRRQIAETSYDTRDRRDRMEAELAERGIDHEVVAARVRADMSQARPATAIRPPQNARTQTIDSRGGQQKQQQRHQDTQRHRPGLQR